MDLSVNLPIYNNRARMANGFIELNNSIILKDFIKLLHTSTTKPNKKKSDLMCEQIFFFYYCRVMLTIK